MIYFKIGKYIVSKQNNRWIMNDRLKQIELDYLLKNPLPFAGTYYAKNDSNLQCYAQLLYMFPHTNIDVLCELTDVEYNPDVIY